MTGHPRDHKTVVTLSTHYFTLRKNITRGGDPYTAPSLRLACATWKKHIIIGMRRVKDDWVNAVTPVKECKKNGNSTPCPTRVTHSFVLHPVESITCNVTYHSRGQLCYLN